MKKLACVLILIFIFTSSAFGEVNKKTVLRAWKNISQAENFPELPMNFENTDEPNAWVAYEDDGDYSVHVTTGLMEILETENEIAGVLAHELGHIQLGHYNNFALSDTVNAIMGANLEHADDLARAVGNINMEMKESKFNREQETEADNYGVKLLVKANYNAWGLYNAMKRFDENGLETEANAFNSHPASEERLANLAKQARTFASENHQEKNKKKNKNKNNNKKKDDIYSLADILMGN